MHDPRFKRLLQEFFAEFFWLFFPDWAERFDFKSRVWLDKELVNDSLEGHSRFVDVVAKLATREPIAGPDGQSEESWLALVHVEIEAADKAAPLRRRMLHYYEPLRRNHGLPVLPIALYLRAGLKGIGWDVYEESFWGEQLVRFRYPYIGLPALDAEKYVKQENCLGIALSALMDVRKERRIELAAEALKRIVHSPENIYRKTLLCECVSAYLPVDAEQRRQFEEMVRNHPDPGVQAMELGLLDYVEQRGVELGIQKGKIEGRLEGKIEGKIEGQRELLRALLEARFGVLPSFTMERLQVLPGDRLADLARALFSAASLDELGLGPSASEEP